MIRTRLRAFALRAALALLPCCLCAHSAAAPAVAPAEAEPGEDDLVRLNLAEGMPLKVLIEFVSQELGLNILYDEQQLADERVTIRAPEQFPRAALLDLLEGALKAKGLALVDAADAGKGWKRVVPLAEGARLVPDVKPGEVAVLPPDAGPSAALTQVFRLQYVEPKQLNEALRPFLSGEGAGSFAVPEQGLLVVTDYASNLKRVGDLVRAIDRPAQDVSAEFFPVKFADAARLTQQLELLLKARVRSAGGGDRAADAVETAYDARTNQIAVIAPRERMEDARKMIQALDVAVPERQSPVRFYKLANATAADVLTTIRALEEGGDELPPTRTPPRPSATRGGRPMSPSASPRLEYERPGLRRRPRDGAAEDEGSGASFDASTGARLSDLDGASRAEIAMPRGFPMPRTAGEDTGEGSAGVGTLSQRGSAADDRTRQSLHTSQARVTADPNTNSIIVIGPPDVQRLYEQLIRALDKRRPQVLIEATIVTIDTSGDFQLGVEIGRKGGTDDNQVITFSSFGLSTPNRDTGRLTITPGLGFNGALLSTDIADVVLRALQGHSRARVTSAPRILVNDNSIGALTSIAEFPFASVNASDTIATTSFGDYAVAGTEITVTPHISESDYLQLEYSVSLSSFTGPPVTQSGVTLPPPRKSDAVQSQVTIPDGSTIVVGGLNRRNRTEEKDAVPFLGDIPVLEFLFSNRTTTEQNGTLFVFLRPVILRDDEFEDLKYLSERDAREAGIPSDYPRSEPVAIP